MVTDDSSLSGGSRPKYHTHLPFLPSDPQEKGKLYKMQRYFTRFRPKNSTRNRGHRTVSPFWPRSPSFFPISEKPEFGDTLQCPLFVLIRPFVSHLGLSLRLMCESKLRHIRKRGRKGESCSIRKRGEEVGTPATVPFSALFLNLFPLEIWHYSGDTSGCPLFCLCVRIISRFKF